MKSHKRPSAHSLKTHSGRTAFLAAPRAEDLHWRDVAEHLAKINRHVGATALPLSVAEHCVRVADILPPDAKPYGLLHDAHEYVLGDNSSPLKELLREEYGYPMLLDKLEHRHDQIIYPAAGLTYPVPECIKRAVKVADLTMLATEMRDLKPAFKEADIRHLPPPDRQVIKPWPWARAADIWLQRLQEFCPDVLEREAV